jgi:ATP-binding cassette, subfamily B, bacterial
MPTSFPFYRQFDAMDCGPACLRMVARHYGRAYSLQYLREHSYLDREGVSLRGIMEAAEHIGLRSLPVKLPFASEGSGQAGLAEAPLPAIVHWQQRHFVVLYRLGRKHAWIADPGVGKRKITHAEFKRHWLGEGDQGVALLLEPTPEFYQSEAPQQAQPRFQYYLAYLRPYRHYFGQLFLGLFLASLIQLAFPFLTQAIVDVGIQNVDLGFVYLVLIAQLTLFLGQTAVTVIQNWILLHLGARLNLSLLSDFLAKLMQLPISYFDAKMAGDLLQRIADQRRIESFLTSSTLSFVFSAFNLLVFGLVLLIYNLQIFAVFLVGSLLYLGWILLFLRRRQEVDYLRFQELSDNQSSLIEIIQGMPEIKLQNSGRKRRWQWSEIQARLFRANLKTLSIEQYQDNGAAFISQIKDILIVFLAAKLVIDGQITLGMMLAVQFIVGQLNVPLRQLAVFVRSSQDARLSLERLMEVQQLPPEEDSRPGFFGEGLPADKSLHLSGLSFRYNKLADFALQDIELDIPYGETTAIVGASGSGKTTLLKLLLGFYEPQQGQIRVGGIPLAQLSHSLWRSRCGAVLQDGFIFSDTIASNIAESSEQIDRARLLRAAEIANVREFIEQLPLGFNTMVGPRGNGLSQGQRQRILIARAVYKEPDFLFFDEATNALDAPNERDILEKLQGFFAGRTAIVVAHRLSTVKNAGQIVVLDQGRIVEKGRHEELIAQKGAYYKLIRNQLELGP